MRVKDMSEWRIRSGWCALAWICEFIVIAQLAASIWAKISG